MKDHPSLERDSTTYEDNRGDGNKIDLEPIVEIDEAQASIDR